MNTVLLKKMATNIMLALILVLTMLFAACGETISVTDISIKTTPVKTEYDVGDIFSAEGGVILVTYSDETTKDVSFTESGVQLSTPDMSKTGKQKVTVTYQSKTADFEINVKEVKQVASIAIKTLPSKVQYLAGQSLAPAGGVLTVTYSDNTTGEVAFTAEGVTFSEIESASAGKTNVTVTYGGKTATFEVTIVDAGEQKPVGRIAVKTKPVKTEYIAGDTFDPEGGVILVTYTDKTTEEVALDDVRITLSVPDMGDESMEESVTRTVTVTFGKKKTTFTIGISAIGGVVEFDTNCADVPSFTVKVAKGTAVAEPAVPERSGYTFYKWYEDKNCTIEYEFKDENIISENTTIYAQWKENGATYYDVTFKYNYYGLKRNTFTQIVKSGECARPMNEPTRSEFRFDGWFTDAGLTAAYSASQPINGNMTILAKWSKTKTGSSEYVFEAEDTDLTGKKGPGYSGEANDSNLIVEKKDLNVSGDKAVSYLYRKGLSLEFHIACSEATTATLKISMGAELDGVNLNQDNYKIYVNDVSMPYSVNLVNGAKFKEVSIGEIQLKEGYNIIRLVTDNSAPELDGTYEAIAPMIDCIKLETTAVLMWDGNYGLPMSY